MVHVFMSEDNFVKSVPPSLRFLGSHQTWVVRIAQQAVLPTEPPHPPPLTQQITWTCTFRNETNPKQEERKKIMANVSKIEKINKPRVGPLKRSIRS